MADISELVLDVRNRQAIQSIGAVDSELKKVGKTGIEVGKTIFAGWSFGQLIDMTKKMGDAFKDVLLVTRQFDRIFGKGNRAALVGVNNLTTGFNETERSAKKLLSIIGSRIDFGFNSEQLAQMSAEIAKVSENIATVFGADLIQTSQKITSALTGEVDGLKELGIVIDKESDKFKSLVADMKNTAGATDKAAQAIVIYNEVLKNAQKYEGAFAEQAGTISQAFGDIANTLKSGLFAKSGEFMSAILVPALEKLNAFLSKPWVAIAGGFTTAVTIMSAAFGSLYYAITSSIPLVEKGIDALRGSFVAGIKDSFAKVMIPVQKAVINYQRREQQHLILMWKDLTNVLGSNNPTVKKCAEDIKTYTASIKTQNKKLATYIYKPVEVLKDFYDKLKRSPAKALDILNQGYMWDGAITGFALTFVQGLWSALSNLGKGLLVNFKALLIPVQATLTGLIPIVSYSFKAINKVIIGSLNGLRSMIQPVMLKLAEMISTTFVTLYSSLRRGLLSGKVLGKKVGKSFAASALGSALGTFTLKLKDILKSIGHSLFVVFGAFFKGIGVVILGALKTLAVTLAGIVGFFTSVPAAIVAGILAVLAGVGTLIYNKVKTGSWFDFSAFGNAVTSVFTKIGDWIVEAYYNLGERIVNLLSGRGFHTNTAIATSVKDAVNKAFTESERTFAAVDEQIRDYYQTVADNAKDPVTLAEEAVKNFSDINHKFTDLDKKYQSLLRTKRAYKKVGGIEGFEDKYKELEEELLKIGKARQEAWEARQKAEQRSKDAQTKLLEYDKQQADLAKERAEAKKAQLKALKDTTLDYYKALYGNFVWFKDQALNLFDSVKKVPTKFKLNVIDEQMDKLKRSFAFREGDSLVEGYKELGELEMERFRLQMDHLNRENEAIQSSNEVISKFFEKVTSFRAEGTSGIDANSAEGYKYLTSSIHSLENISPVLQHQQNATEQLEQKKISLAQSTLNTIKAIKKHLDLNTYKASGGGDSFLVVN